MKLSKGIMCLLLIVVSFMLNACSGSGTKMQFRFSTSAAANSNDSKTICVNEDMDRLELDAVLKIDSGKVTIEVVDVQTNEVIWSKDYSEDSNFKMELAELKADNEYLIEVQAIQSKKVELTITTDEKLISDKEKPARNKIK